MSDVLTTAPDFTPDENDKCFRQAELVARTRLTATSISHHARLRREQRDASNAGREREGNRGAHRGTNVLSRRIFARSNRQSDSREKTETAPPSLGVRKGHPATAYVVGILASFVGGIFALDTASRKIAWFTAITGGAVAASLHLIHL